MTEKETAVTSEGDTQHIVLTSTDTIEDRRIAEYIDVISVLDILFQSIHFDLVLEKNPAKLKNITLLPCPEGELKLAIKILLMLHIAKDDTVDVEALKRRYIGIASFQQITCEDMAALTKLMERANEDAQMSDRDAYSSYQKYLDLALAQQNTLLDDINNFIGSIEGL